MTALAVVLALIAGFTLGIVVMHVRNQQLRYSHHILETDLNARKDAALQPIRHTPPHGTRTL